MKIKRNVVAVSVSVALFVTALTQVGFYAGADSAWTGWDILIYGWMDLILLVGVNWLANPALFLAYIFMLSNKYRAAAIASLVSVICATSFLARRTITLDITAPITGYGVGYWLWLASTIVMALSSFYLIYVSEREVSTSIDDSSKKSEGASSNENSEEEISNKSNDKEGNK